MRVDIGDGVRLWFDVEGIGLVPDGDRMCSRPTLVLLHGGPGLDHSAFKPAFSQLADVCQLVYYDHRGQGRSDRRTPDEWTLDVWADDVVRFCDAIGVERPIVLGNSFGGMVAQRYAHRHPGHASRIVLSSTAARMDLAAIVAMFAKLGGAEAAEVARAFWTDPTPEHQIEYLQTCGPLYTQTPGNIFDTQRMVRNMAVLEHFVTGEQLTFDELPSLGAVTEPVLVMAGALDPVCPLKASEDIVAHLPPHLVRFECFDDCGHGVFRDDPDRAFAVLREFIAEEAAARAADDADGAALTPG
uniref:Putative Prolyl aminopeptidase n=1 Tax=uncultured bacterium A1Q1_fos_515 TaxID=1256581 RepID=L7VQW1_9BACT|nr:putative Prolyl aminopeptidase [uncultured bacterium A1Q1_fos_515]